MTKIFEKKEKFAFLNRSNMKNKKFSFFVLTSINFFIHRSINLRISYKVLTESLNEENKLPLLKDLFSKIFQNYLKNGQIFLDTSFPPNLKVSERLSLKILFFCQI